MRTPVAILLAVAVTGALALSACGDDDSGSATPTRSAATPASGGAEPTANPTLNAAAGEVCSSVDGFRSALGSIAEARNVDDIQAAAEQTSVAAKKLKDAASDAGAAGANDLDDALDDFVSSMDEATQGDRPVRDALAVLADALGDIQVRLQNVADSEGCD
jgi:hypothetical protein